MHFITNKMQRKFLLTTLLTAIVLTIYKPLVAWTEHPLLMGPAISGHPAWANLKSVEAKSIEDFIQKNGKALEVFLQEQEQWSRNNLPNYLQRPDNLAFKAIGSRSEMRRNFLYAIRINPNVKLPLYIHLLPNEMMEDSLCADPAMLTTLSNIDVMKFTKYKWLQHGSLVSPMSVMISATDEPDYGFDLGLFQDNPNAFGPTYGFDKQPFGNPNLEYSSQAPFHMGFYHESGIIFAFAPFLKHTFVDYRINLFRGLSEFAFASNEPYWGWRFMGWAMHYLGDLTVPYHCKPLPGVSTWKMLWINLKAILGWEKDKIDAIQLVSNKHTVFEKFTWFELRKALYDNNLSHPLIQALKDPLPAVQWDIQFPYQVVSKQACEKAVVCNDALLAFMPDRLVNDPAIEAFNTVELDDLVHVVRSEKGQEAVDGLDAVIAERFRAFSMAMNSFLDYMLPYALGNQSEIITKKPNT